MNIKQFLQKNGDDYFNRFPIEERKYKRELADHLLEFEDKYKGKEVICTEYQLGRGTNGFSLNMKELRRKKAMIECAFYVKTNWDSKSNGRLFILDEAATEKNLLDKEKFKEKQIEAHNMAAEVGEEVANAIKALGKNAKQKVKTNN